VSSQSYEPFPESAAARWGLFGFWASLVLLLLIAAAQISAHWANPAVEILPGPLGDLAAAGLAATMTGSLVVRAGAQVRRQQWQIYEALLRRIEALEADADAAPDQVNGLTPEMVQIARDVSARLNHAK